MFGLVCCWLGENWSHSGYILKVELTRCAGGWMKGVREKRSQEGSHYSGLITWVGGVPLMAWAVLVKEKV